MSAKEYIESGMLELYVAGALSPEEAEEVQRMAEEYPDVAKELAALEADMEALARKAAIEPPAVLLSKVKTAIENPESLNKPKSEGKTVTMKPEKKKSGGGSGVAGPRLGIARWLAVAASILLLVSVGLNVNFNSKLQAVKQTNTQLENEIAELQNEQGVIADQLDAQKANYNQLAGLLNDPTTVPVRMEGQPIQPDARATVLWQQSSQQVYLFVDNLPMPDEDKQYQLWALVDGKPVDAGVFDVKEGLQQLKNMPEADAFAVTLEPYGGSESPTLEQLYVVGGV